MTVLITGGTARTGRKLSELLTAKDYPVLLTSRSGTASENKAVQLNWFDEKTFENPFKADANIDKIYLVAPPVYDTLKIVKPFIDLAVSKGVKRIFFCSSSAMDKGSFSNGKVHEYIAGLGIEYVVLRPTWFSDNFASVVLAGILEHDRVYSSAGDGKIPFVIVKAAFDAIVATKSSNTDFHVLGPKAYSHDEAMATLSNVIGRKITHERIPEKAVFDAYVSLGAEKDYANMLASLMTHETAKGAEEALLSSDKAILGTTDLHEYFEANKGVWIKK